MPLPSVSAVPSDICIARSQRPKLISDLANEIGLLIDEVNFSIDYKLGHCCSSSYAYINNFLLFVVYRLNCMVAIKQKCPCQYWTG